MSGAFLVFNLIISIAIMIALILVPKFNPALSLVIASIYMGVTCGLGFVNSIETIGTGFGNMMAGIGLPIGFGVILGQLMSDTGAAKVIARTIVHIGNALVSTLNINSGSVLKTLLLAYFIGCIFRIAQGSGTVAGITAMTIMATIAPSVSVHPVYIALAALAGGISVGHVNDSGFWVVSNMSGFNVKGGLKTYTLAQIIMSVSIMFLTVIFALILPGAIG